MFATKQRVLASFPSSIRRARNIWTSGDTYENRVTTLTDVGGLLEANVRVLDDGFVDKLKGKADLDLFFTDLGGSDEDDVEDQNSDEDLFELFEPL